MVFNITAISHCEFFLNLNFRTADTARQANVPNSVKIGQTIADRDFSIFMIGTAVVRHLGFLKYRVKRANSVPNFIVGVPQK